MKKEKRNLQQVFSFLLLLVTLAVVVGIGLNGNDLEDLLAALKRLSPAFVLLCIACWALYVLFNALTMYHFLKVQGHPVKLRESLYAAMIGIYYCNVTPGATGGQPMEMYALSKYGVPVGVSGSGMAVKFVLFQTVLLITGAALWLTHLDFVREYAGGSWWFVLLGYLANFFTIGMVLLMAISQKAVRWVIDRCISIGVKLHLCKDAEASKEKWENHCASFLGSVQLMMRRPRDLLVQCLIALTHLMSLMLVIIAVYHALGLQGVSTMELITMGVLLYIGASYTPLPGASGAQEGGFAVMFRGIFPDALLFVALMIWRFCTYYLSVLVGAAMTIAENLSSLRGKKGSPVSRN